MFEEYTVFENQNLNYLDKKLSKSTNEERMKGNIDIFDFELTDEEMKNMQALDTNKPSHNPEDPANETRLMGLKIHD